MIRMSRLFATLLLLLLAAAPAAAQDSTAVAPAEDHAEDEAAATEAADSWLALVDLGDYDASYASASDLLQGAITREQWVQTMENMASQLAALDPSGADADLGAQRSFIGAQYATELPQAPAGEYVVVQYRRVVGTQPLTEVVILSRSEDAWSVAGYFARPEEGGQ